MQLEDTFGYALGMKRLARGPEWSEAYLAETLCNLHKTEQKYTEEHIYDWEANWAVPDRQVIQVLAQLLIWDNDKVPSNKKEEVSKEFMGAAEATRIALERGEKIDLRDEQFLGRKIRKLMAGMDEKTVLTALSIYADIKPTAEDIWKLEHGYTQDKKLLEAVLHILFEGKTPQEIEEENTIRSRFTKFSSGSFKKIKPSLSSEQQVDLALKQFQHFLEKYDLADNYRVWENASSFSDGFKKDEILPSARKLFTLSEADFNKMWEKIRSNIFKIKDEPNMQDDLDNLGKTLRAANKAVINYHNQQFARK